jgi:hypothetical protein
MPPPPKWGTIILSKGKSGTQTYFRAYDFVQCLDCKVTSNPGTITHCRRAKRTGTHGVETAVQLMGAGYHGWLGNDDETNVAGVPSQYPG